MTKTPKHEQIVELAKELYYRDMAKTGMENFNSPEIGELSESGFLAMAQSLLMRSSDAEYKSHIEEEAQRLNLTRERKGLTVNVYVNAKKAKQEPKIATFFRLGIILFFIALLFGVTR